MSIPVAAVVVAIFKGVFLCVKKKDLAGNLNLAFLNRHVVVVATTFTALIQVSRQIFIFHKKIAIEFDF